MDMNGKICVEIEADLKPKRKYVYLPIKCATEGCKSFSRTGKKGYCHRHRNGQKVADPVVIREPGAKRVRNRPKCCTEGCKSNSRGDKKNGHCKRHLGGPRCGFVGCTNSAADTKFLRCRTHLGGLRCKTIDCTKPAADKSSGFCYGCSGGRRCSQDGCPKIAQGATFFCIAHGGYRRCENDGCISGAMWPSNNCARHTAKNICAEIDCTRNVKWNTLTCSSHGFNRCTFEGCPLGAILKDGTCNKHVPKTTCTEEGCTFDAECRETMCVRHGKNKCIYQTCITRRRNGFDTCVQHITKVECIDPDCKNTAAWYSKYCVGHSERGCIEPECMNGAADMVSRKCLRHLGKGRCPNCIDWTDSRAGNPKYDGYCITCFVQEFPEDKRSIRTRARTKELMVRNRINTEFGGFSHDRPIYTGNCDCTHRRRIDHRKLIGNTIIAIETDEFAHRGYNANDEEIRYDDLYMVFSGKWIFIRFNPDSNREQRGCKTDIAEKLDVLVEAIRENISRIQREENTELLEIQKLYC